MFTLTSKNIPQSHQKGHQAFLPGSPLLALVRLFFPQFEENESHKKCENMVEVDKLRDSNRAGMLLVLTSPEQAIHVWHALPNKLQLQKNQK